MRDDSGVRPGLGKLCCYAFCRQGIQLAARLRQVLVCRPEGPAVEAVYAPVRLVANDLQWLTGFTRLSEVLERTWKAGYAHLFIGACGLAVRAIAPFIGHKSQDPPVVVMDPAGRFCISLLSGHLGGANALARQLAGLVEATPVISTASDTAGAPALDLYLQAADMQVLDWHELPRLQGMLLEGHKLLASDPWRQLPPRDWLNYSTPPASGSAHLLVSWFGQESRPGAVRVLPRSLSAGIGYRKHVQPDELLQGYTQALAQARLDSRAVAIWATVEEKFPLVHELAGKMGLRALGFAASRLGKIQTSGASLACGRRFAQDPFSVCEAAALLAASSLNPAGHARLIVAKIVVNHTMTFAFAANIAGSFHNG